MSEKRIISLSAAATDIVCALGFKEYLIDHSHSCDLPGSIPRAVNAILSKASDSSGSNQTCSNEVELLGSKTPIIVVAQAQCAICETVTADLKSRFNGEIEVTCLNLDTVKEIFDSILILGEKLDVLEKAEQMIEELKERFELIGHKLKYVGVRPGVVCINGLSPITTAGNLISELIELAGGSPLLGRNQHSGPVAFEQLQDADPDLLIVAPWGFPLERTLQEIHLLLEQPGWANLRAVQNNMVFIADGNQYLNLSSQKVADTAELLAEIIHPKQFVFGFEGKAWLKFSI